MSQSNNFENMREQLHRQMLSAVSHDLKTPLATIIGSLEIYDRMEERLTQEKRSALIKSALGEAYRLDNFITNILDMAKLEGGMVNVNQERCSLNNIINDCITRLSPKRNSCNIKIEPVNGSEWVHSDPMLLGRAIGLVLDNAIKHSGEKPVIKVGHTNDEKGFTIRVQDHGPGIPSGKEKDIFLKYSRFSKGDQHNAGTGLGLAICRQLVSMQGGNVHGENVAEGGALFTLTFPANKEG